MDIVEDVIPYCVILFIITGPALFATCVGHGRKVRERFWSMCGLPLVAASVGFWIPKLIYLCVR